MSRDCAIKNIALIAGTMILFSCIAACTHPAKLSPERSTSPARIAGKTQTVNPAPGPALTIKQVGEKIILSFPVPDKVQINPSYAFPHLNIIFDQAFSLPRFDPNTVPGVINNLEFKQIDAGHTEMHLTLKKEIQFLITRPEPSKLKITIVPQPEIAQRSLATPPADTSILKNIEFSQDQEHKIYITLQATRNLHYQLMDSTNNTLKIALTDIDIPDTYLKLYRLQKFKGVIDKALLERHGRDGILTLYLKHPAPVSIQSKDNAIELVTSGIRPEKDAGQTSTPQAESQEDNKDSTLGKTAALAKDHQSVKPQVTLFPGMKKTYQGRHISIDLQDADIEHVLRLIADVGGFNLILDQDVQGKISLKLDDVPWDQALDLVLLQKDLGMIQQGHILRIATSSKLQQEQARILNARKAELEAQKSQQEMAPLHTEYIQINYSTAAEIEPQISKFLSKRGQSSFDSRTNQLIISDTLNKINKIKRVVRKLDRPERQVLIEARLVYATDQFQRSLGLKWGGGYLYQSTYNGESYNQGIYGTTGDTTAAATTDNNGFAVNLPNQGDTTLGIGAFISKLTGSDLYTLDAQLELGESEGQVKTISSPRVVTLNNQQAEVVQGTKIATKTESESGGTTTEYTEATLKLSVVPQITPDNKLILDLNISDDSPVPGGEDIETKSTKTKLIVNDGETIVIGGVQQITESTAQSRVPGMADIPVLGWLFKNRYKSREKRELLIFIRPKIL